jgi:AGCS family alanine or glycine:cation symporter
MAIFYVLGGLAVIVIHANLIPQAISNAVYYAFNDPMGDAGSRSRRWLSR